MRVAAFLLLVAVGAPAGVAAAEDVEIAQGEGRLKAVLLKPEGPGPFPAVVGLHGCNGLHNGSGKLGSRYRDWGGRLVAQGFADN
jgi:dienelactone hydrolase